MWRYRRFMTSVPIQAINLSVEDRDDGNHLILTDVFTNIKEEYSTELGKIYVEQILHHFFQHLAPLMLKFLGPVKTPTVDGEIFFLSDPKWYRDPNRLTLYEINYVPYQKGKAYDTIEVDLYSADGGLMTPLLESQEDKCDESLNLRHERDMLR